MITLIALPTLVIYVVVLGVAMAILRSESRAEVEQEVARLADNYAARFDGAFREAAVIADTTARFMETEPDLAEPKIYQQLRANVLANPAVYGAAMAFEPGTYKAGDALFCPYVYRGADGLAQMDINREVYDWYGDPQWQWYQAPKRLGRGMWTDPFFDKGAGNVLMVTYSAPFFRDGAIRGVTTVDIMLPTLHKSIGSQILAGVDFVILTSAGQYVYSRIESAIMNKTIFEVAEEVNRPDIAEAARSIVSGESGVVALAGGWDEASQDFEGWTETQWAFYAPIKSTGWAFAALVPQREALAGVHRRLTLAALALAVTLLLIVGCIWYVSGRITRPIVKLRSKVLQIAGGDLDARIEGIGGADEIGSLANSFNRMTSDLRSHVDRLADEQAQREKIERDLDLAREIQRGLLPTQDPHAPGFEIAGWNQAADKTGGDYFDWLELPNGRTVVMLADVTGHGIGPALIAAVCRAYMRASTSTGEVDLSKALARVNDLLHSDLSEGRFVTAVVGIIEPGASRMEILSAGQAPLLFYEAKTDAVHNWDADDLPLGITGDLSFDAPRQVEFGRGDVMLLTTDGFFEWANAAGEQFGTKRLEEFLQNNHHLSPSELIARLHEAVLAHAAGTSQGDDLTALVIKKL